MKIWHAGADPSPATVNGVNSLIYSIAREQAALGHQVTLLLSGTASQAAQMFALENRVRLVETLRGLWTHSGTVSKLVQSEAPEIVHMHSVYIPQQALLARLLKARRIPYVITPNGGVSPGILARRRMKKALYNALVEKRRFRNAASISAVTPLEEEEIRAFVPEFRGAIPCIPNCVEPESTVREPVVNRVAWSRERPVHKLVYLGRLDVQHKGIDILLALARELPQVEFHLFGPGDTANAALHALKQTCPANAFFHEPVFGKAKLCVLAEASLYIQTSRWEAFGISIAEAMYLGLPCAISPSLHMAPWFQRHDLGLVLSSDLSRACREIAVALSNHAQLAEWSRRARVFAREHFHPRAVAQQFIDCYRESLAA